LVGGGGGQPAGPRASSIVNGARCACKGGCLEHGFFLNPGGTQRGSGVRGSQKIGVQTKINQEKDQKKKYRPSAGPKGARGSPTGGDPSGGDRLLKSLLGNPPRQMEEASTHLYLEGSCRGGCWLPGEHPAFLNMFIFLLGNQACQECRHARNATTRFAEGPTPLSTPTKAAQTRR